MTLSPRPAALALAAVLLLVLGTPRAHAAGAFAGETIIHVGDGGHAAWMIGQSQDVGFKYTYVSFLWLDLWSWGGTYCVYQRFEHKYWPISRAEAAQLLNKNEAELEPPFRYRYPLGLIVFGPVFLLGAVGWATQERAKRAAAEAVKLAEDPKYREATTTALVPAGADDAETAAAFEAGVQQLVTAGVDRATAEQNLKTIVASAVTCPACRRRHLLGTVTCRCGTKLPTTAPGTE